MEASTDEHVVIITPTIGDGTVVRWYGSEDAAVRGNEIMSASRNGVLVETFLHKVSERRLADATAAHEALRANHNADVRHLATHRRVRLFGGEIEPIPRP